MKEYLETETGSFTCEGMTIPSVEGNRHYRQMHEEIQAGEAVIIRFDHDAKAAEDAINEERAWRNAELSRADVELFKVQDNRGTGTVTEWRDYRNELRDWPEHAEFPNSEHRPVAPDA